MNQYTFSEIYIGQEESFCVELTEEMMESFQKITGDRNPLHVDENFAKEKGYETKVAYGMLTASFLSTMAGVYMPGENSLIQKVEIKFSKPVFTGNVLKFTGKVSEKNDTFRFILLKVTGSTEDGTKVLKAVMQIGVLK